MASLTSQNQPPYSQSNYMFTTFGALEPTTQPSAVPVQNHQRIIVPSTQSYKQSPHFGGAQTPSFQSTEVLFASSGAKVNNSFPHLVELVESVHGATAAAQPHTIVNTQPFPLQADVLHGYSKGQKQQTNYEYSHPTPKVPFLTEVVPSERTAMMVRNASTSKLEVNQHIARSVSGSSRDVCGLNLSENQPHLHHTPKSPIIIGSQAFDSLMHNNNHNRQKSLGRLPVVQVAASREKSIQRIQEVPTVNRLLHIQAQNVVCESHHRPPQRRMPPLPNKVKPQKQSPVKTERRYHTEEVISYPADATRLSPVNPESIFSGNVLPSFPSPAAVNTPIFNMNRQSLSPSKNYNRAQSTTQEATLRSSDSHQQHTSFPSPINLMKKESIESVAPALTVFNSAHTIERKVTSPISNLADLTNHAKSIHHESPYVSRGLLFSASTKTIPTSNFVSSSQQNRIGHFENALSNISSINQYETPIQTPTFNTIPIEPTDSLARNNSQSKISLHEIKVPQSQQQPNSIVAPVSNAPASSQQPKQPLKSFAIMANFRPQIVEPVTSMSLSKTPVKEEPPVLVIPPPPPIQEPPAVVQTVFDALPFIAVEEYMPQKGVQMPENGDIFYYPTEANKELVDRSVQWESKIGLELNQSNQLNEGSIQKGVDEPKIIESEEIIVTKQLANFDTLQRLVSIEVAEPIEIVAHVQQSSSKEIVTTTNITAQLASLPRNSVLQAGLRVIYGEEGTKKYQEFLRGVEQKNLADKQPEQLHFQGLKHARSIEVTSPLKIRSSPTPTPSTANTTVMGNFEFEIAKNYIYEPTSTAPTANFLSDQNTHKAFDSYAYRHNNQYVHETSWRAPAAGVVVNRETDIPSEAVVAGISNATINRYETTAPNEYVPPRNFTDSDRTQTEKRLTSTDNDSSSHRRNNLLANRQQERSRSRTPLTGLPKMLSYEDLRQRLHQDEAELLQYHK